MEKIRASVGMVGGHCRRRDVATISAFGEVRGWRVVDAGRGAAGEKDLRQACAAMFEDQQSGLE